MTQSAGIDRPVPHALIVQAPNTQVLLTHYSNRDNEKSKVFLPLFWGNQFIINRKIPNVEVPIKTNYLSQCFENFIQLL